MKKIFWIIGLVLLLLIILVSVGVGLYLGPIVKIGMEQVGPKVTQVTVKVDAVDVSLVTGSAKVKGFMVGNPSGYTAPQAISVGTIAVSVDPFSVTSAKMVVRSVRVESPVITFESRLGGSNLSKIMDNVNSFSKNAPSANTTAQANNKPAPKIEVDDFLITGAKVQVVLPGLGSKEIPLPDIHLTDLGKGDNGLTPVQLTSAVLDAILKDTVATVASSAQILGKGVNIISNSITGLFGK